MSRWSLCFLLILSLPCLLWGQQVESNVHELLVKELNDPSNSIYKVDHSSSGEQLGPYFKGITRKPSFEVFGWYPYWKEEVYNHLEYSLLSTIAYFAYEIKPSNGKAKKTHDWSKTPMLDSAKANGVKLLLAVENYGTHNNSKFLKSVAARSTFIDAIVQLLKEGKGQGICLDFEGINVEHKDSLSAFVKSIRTRFIKEGKAWSIYLTLPLSDASNAYDLETLAQVVSRFVVTGYAYYTKGSENAGPIAPLNGGDDNLTQTVSAYTQHVKPGKLILGLPFFGMMWETKSDDPEGKAHKYLGVRTFDYIVVKTDNIKTHFDSIAKSAYKSYQTDRIGNTFRQFWFENGQSLTYKLDYITQQKLAGVAVWALGYDIGQPELWQAIATTVQQSSSVAPENESLSEEPDAAQGDEKARDATATVEGNQTGNGEGGEQGGDQKGDEGSLTTDTTDTISPIDKIIEDLKPVEAIIKPYVSIKSVVALMLLLLVFFAGLGILAAMLFPDTRQFFFNSSVRKTLLIWSVFFVLVTLLRLQNWLTDTSLLILSSFMLGALAMNLINRYLNKIKNNLP
ncbi:MAG: hypothetical protein CL843_01010 [Crocinitomicaceae bacterium]|nr:hypothetical protein [Crocinitomicaceae bacterium]